MGTSDLRGATRRGIDHVLSGLPAGLPGARAAYELGRAETPLPLMRAAGLEGVSRRKGLLDRRTNLFAARRGSLALWRLLHVAVHRQR